MGIKGEEERRTNGTAGTEHTTGAGAEGQAKDKRREGRQERGADGLAPGEWRRRGTKRRHGSRGRDRQTEKRVCNIFNGEKRGKRR